MIWDWWRLVSSPAKDHESIMLELLEVWEPTDSSRAWRFSPGTRSCSSVFSRAWLDEARLVSIRDSLQFGHHHEVSKVSRGGGLALFWKKNFDLHIESFSQITLMF